MGFSLRSGVVLCWGGAIWFLYFTLSTLLRGYLRYSFSVLSAFLRVKGWCLGVLGGGCLFGVCCGSDSSSAFFHLLLLILGVVCGMCVHMCVLVHVKAWMLSGEVVGVLWVHFTAHPCSTTHGKNPVMLWFEYKAPHHNQSQPTLAHWLPTGLDDWRH